MSKSWALYGLKPERLKLQKKNFKMCVFDLYSRLVNKHLPKRMNTIGLLVLPQLDTIVRVRDYEMLCVLKHSEPQSFILLSFYVVVTS
jgi:hypothetical protein